MAHTIAHGRRRAQRNEYVTRDELAARDYDDGYAEDRVIVEQDTDTLARDRYGGLNVGAAFFGWIVAAGMTLILAAVFAAIGLSSAATSVDAVTGETIRNFGLASGIGVLLAMALGYFSGGYVAGRMSRFDGGRQGIGVFAFGLLAMILLAVLGTILGDNILANINLPAVIDTSNLTAAGMLSALVMLAIMLAAAFTGGKAGERYHHRVDRAVYDA